MRLMLDDPDSRAIPRNLRDLGWQAGNEAEHVQRHLLDDVRRYQRGDTRLGTGGCVEKPATTLWPESDRSFARQTISSPRTPGSMTNTPAPPCTTMALLWQNSLSWIRTPSAICLSTGSFRLWLLSHTQEPEQSWPAGVCCLLGADVVDEVPEREVDVVEVVSPRGAERLGNDGPVRDGEGADL
jgi:hypothetical protein